MEYKINDYFYEKIENKMKEGIFTKGTNYQFVKYDTKKDIQMVPISERTPELCSSLMAYGKCKFLDVPNISRTREFFLNSFNDFGVYHYIKENISDFDRQFFKDLLATNSYSTSFSRNCFEIMPLEFIDEEMCSLAIVCSINWICDAWFFSVYKRKPEALTADLWKLGARLYARLSNGKNQFLHITPEQYKDEEYYKEMCLCNFNYGASLYTNKGKIMNTIPKEMITNEFLFRLLSEDFNTITTFSEDALEKEISYFNQGDFITGKLWQFVLRNNGTLIKYIKLNDERVTYFFNHYDKDSIEYKHFFKDLYKKYKKEKRNREDFFKTNQKIQRNMEDRVSRVFFNALIYSMENEDFTKAIEEDIYREEKNDFLLPIRYEEIIPKAFCKKYDSEEYLEELYKVMGIQIIEEYDDLFYQVKLPKGL